MLLLDRLSVYAHASDCSARLLAIEPIRLSFLECASFSSYVCMLQLDLKETDEDVP